MIHFTLKVRSMQKIKVSTSGFTLHFFLYRSVFPPLLRKKCLVYHHLLLPGLFVCQFPFSPNEGEMGVYAFCSNIRSNIRVDGSSGQ